MGDPGRPASIPPTVPEHRPVSTASCAQCALPRAENSAITLRFTPGQPCTVHPSSGVAHQATESSSCTYVSKNDSGLWPDKDPCSHRHYFICQAGGLFSNQDASYARSGSEKIRREDKGNTGPHLSATCHHSASAPASRTLCHPRGPTPPVPPTGLPPGVTDTAAPRRQPDPRTPEHPRPALGSPIGDAPEELTSRPTDPSAPGPLRTLSRGLLHNVSDQVLDELAGNLSKTIRGLQGHSQLQEACESLQRLTAFLPRFSEPTQVSIINSFIHLNKEFLLNPPEDCSDASVTVCLFRPLHEAETEEVGRESWQQARLSSQQEEAGMPGLPSMALGKSPEEVLPQSPFAESSVVLTSSVATLMLSSQNRSTLPLSSFTLGDPAPVRLAFPSATALKELLKDHPGVDVQVTGLAFNPFRDFDDTNIVGSIGNVLLSSDRKLLRLHDLMGDIEITLWRNVSLEMQPTSLNISADHFVISVNITTLEKSLIVYIETETPLPMTLYLGFQYQPSHTHFHRKISLPKGQAQEDEEYTWVLTPQQLEYGLGTYYVTAVLNHSTEGTQQSATAFSVVTAVTQCYFWDSHNSTWRSDECQVGPQSTVHRTQCLCKRLTFFSSDFFIVPRTVDVGDTVKLFLQVTKNPVGVSLLASFLGLYLLLLTWAWRKDQDDRQKVKVTVLADNEPGCQFRYLVQVNTGYRRRAATTAKVTEIPVLCGSVAEPSASPLRRLSHGSSLSPGLGLRRLYTCTTIHCNSW